MGVISQGARNIRRRDPGLMQILGGGQVPSQPGDPNFSLARTPGSQLQFPAAAAESRVNDVQSRAQNQLQAAQFAGLDVTGDEYRELNQAAQQGFIPRALTLGESMLGFIGGPFEAVNTLIQDIAGGESTHATLGDYANALWGGVEDDEAFYEKTGMRPESFSNTLTMFGWAPGDSLEEKVLRGIVDFGSSMLIDPLTYLTGGLAGLGRKAAVSAGRAVEKGVAKEVLGLIAKEGLDEGGNVARHIIAGADDVSDYAKHLAATHGETISNFQNVMSAHVDDIAQGNLDSDVVKDLMRYLKPDDASQLNALYTEKWEQLAVTHRIGEEVLRPLSQRNFGAINDLALKELPIWARGGLRIGLPAFTERFADVAIEIPHTRGLGRKLVGDPMRALSDNLKKLSPKYDKIASAMSSGRMSFDAYRPILNGLRDGTIAPWQYEITATAMDSIHNQAARQRIAVTLNHHAKNLLDLGESKGESSEAIFKTLRDRLEMSGDDMALFKQAEELIGPGESALKAPGTVSGYDRELDAAINEAATFMRSTMDDMHTAMSALDPKFKEKYIDGYIPYIMSDDGRHIINSFVSKGQAVPSNDWADAAERGEPGLALLARTMNAHSVNGRVESSLGSNVFQDRTTRIQAQLLVNDGPLMLSENDLTDMLLRNQAVPPVGPGGVVATDALKTKYPPVSQINEWYKAAIEANAEKYGVHLPRNWDGKVLKENPIESMMDYVAAMDDTIKQWTMVDAMKKAGLVTRHRTAIDVQDVVQKMMGNLNRIAHETPVTPSEGQVQDLIVEIGENPKRFAFHSTEADKAAKIADTSQKAGGIYSDREAAEKFVRHEGSTAERRVLVYDLDELPPSVRDPIERAGEIGDVRGIPRGTLKPVGSYDPAKGIESFQPTARIQSVLRGRENLVDGVPRSAIGPMRDAGLDPSDISGTKKLYQTVEGLNENDFKAMRNEVQDYLPGVVTKGFRAGLEDGKAFVHYVTDTTLDAVEAGAAREKALLSLDKEFTSGSLKGKLNHETMVELAQQAPNDETSELLYSYYKNKMASLGDKAREYLGSNPGEFVEITALADDFLGAVNEFITDYSGYRSLTTDELVQGGRQAQQLARKDSPVAQRLKGLREAARDLKDRGYDEASEIMRAVDDWTGVNELPNYMSPANLGLAGPAVDGMVVQRNIGLWLKNVSRNTAAVYTPEGIAAAKLATNELIRTWRALATVARPSFHIRNAVGAAWMNSNVGVRAETYAAIKNNTLKWRKALAEGLADPFSVIDKELQPAWRAMEEQGVLTGFVSSEFRKALNPTEKASRLAWLKANDVDNFVLTRVGGKTMQTIEDVARAALFLEYYGKGGEGADIVAREIVNAIHFDYNDLTPWETKIKSVVPFFVWTRRNLPRQIEMMVERPRVVEKYRHMLQSMNDNLNSKDDNGLPTGDNFSAFAAGTGFYVNPGTPFWARAMIDPDLPISDLVQLPGLNNDQLFSFASGLLGPPLGTILQINEEREFGDVNASGPLAGVLKSLAAVGFFDETIDGDVRIPYWMRTVQETALPFSREIIDPLTGGPSDPNRQQRLGISEADDGMTSSLKALVASLGKGVGVKFNTPVDVRSTTARSNDELDKIIAGLRAEGLLPPGQ